MELFDLRCLVALSQGGGVLGVAQAMGRAPSSISTRLQALERDVGVPLFIRGGRSLVLSRQGQAFLERATVALSIIDAATEQARDEASGTKVRLGATESTAATIVPDVLSRLRQSSPRTRVDVASGSSRGLVDKVISAELDVALVNHFPRDARLNAAAVGTEELVIVAPPGVGTSRDLYKALPILTPIVSSQDCTYWERLQQWYATQTPRAPEPMRMHSLGATLRCVSAGLGLSMLPRNSLGDSASHNRVSVHPIDPELARLETTLVWARDKKHQGVAAVRAALKL